MATRSRTLLFTQYRRLKASRGPPAGHGTESERAGLIAPDGDGATAVVEMSMLPPKWLDAVDDLEEDMTKIKELLGQLQALHKRHLMPGFDDRGEEEREIELMTTDITNLFQSCQRRIKRIQTQSRATVGPRGSAALGRNVQASLAAKLQNLSGEFRQQQSSYLERLRGRAERSKNIFTPSGAGMEDGEGADTFEGVFLDDQQELIGSNDKQIAQREREIEQIAKSIQSLAIIFKDMQTMVVEQGTILDRIDYNVEQTARNVESAVEELQKGAEYQSSTRNKLAIICLLIGIVICVLIIIFKPRRH
ncbi:t-SNARE [Hyaloraphidium curvatum]|nr:t-SNARE [Hyaloraphidium curvatum]